MDKTLREALDKVSQGLRELAVVIDSALATPDSMDSLAAAITRLTERLDVQEATLANHASLINETRDDHHELARKVEDMDASFDDRCDDRINEKVQEIDLTDRISEAVDDHDFSEEVEQAIESALSGRKVEAIITF